MERKEFSELGAAKKMWLRLDYASERGRMRSALLTVAALAVLWVVISVTGALASVGLGLSDRHQVKLGSAEEKVLSSYVNMMGFESGQGYERYAKAARAARLDSAWVPQHAVESWLAAGLPSAVHDAFSKKKSWADWDPKGEGYYAKVASEWAQYKSVLKEAVGPMQQCSVLRAVGAGLPWAQASEQPGACQVVSYQNWGFKLVAGAGIIFLFFVGLFVSEMLGKRTDGVLDALFGWPRKQGQAFTVWLEKEGYPSLTRWERGHLSLSTWRLKSVKLKKRDPPRL